MNIRTLIPIFFVLLPILPVSAQGRVPSELDRALRGAEDLIATGKSPEALDVLKRLRYVDTKDPRIPFLMAQCEFNLWRSDRALKKHLEGCRGYIRDAFALKHPWPECSFLSGWIEFEAENWPAAERACREAITGRFGVAVASQRLALSLFHRGVAMASGAEANSAKSRGAADVFSEARDRLRELAQDTRLLPDQRRLFRDYWIRAWTNLVAMHQKSGYHRVATEELQELIRTDPGDPRHYLNLGLLHIDTGASKKAVTAFEKSLAAGKKTGFDEARIHLASLWSTKFEREKAEEQFTKYFERHPDSWMGHFERGEHYLRFEEYEKAIDDFGRCLSIDPKAAHAMESIAEAYRLNGDTEKANEWTKKFLDRDRVKPAPPPEKREKDPEPTPEKKDEGAEEK